jgi:sodium transport system ATP-binding protein
MQEVAALCDRIVVLSRGSVVAIGTASELIARAGTSSLEDAFVALLGTEEGIAA